MFLDRRAGIRLRDADADERIAVRRGGEPALLHGLGTQVLDAPGGAVEGQLAANGGGDIRPGDLFEDDGRLDVPQPMPPYFSPIVIRRRSALAKALRTSGGNLTGLVTL